MEKPSERPPNQVEDAEGRCRGPQSRMDDYLTVSGGDEANVGSQKHDLEGYAGRAGGREIHSSGEGREGPGLQMGSHEGRCRLLDRENGSYSCWTCPGGLSFSECQRLRGEIK